MKGLLFPGNSSSSRISFFRSFLTLQTCWQSFCLENLTITSPFVLPTRWYASIWSGEISQPSFPKIFKTFSSRTSPDTSRGMLTISRHSRLEYWAFAQHCLSKVDNLVTNKLLTFFVMASSACSFWIHSFTLRTSSRTLLSLSSDLLCRDRALGIRSCLRSLSSELPVYVAIFQLIKSYQGKNTGCKVRKLEILHIHVSLRQSVLDSVEWLNPVEWFCLNINFQLFGFLFL